MLETNSLYERIAQLEAQHQKLSTEYFDIRSRLKEAEAAHDLLTAGQLKHKTHNLKITIRDLQSKLDALRLAQQREADETPPPRSRKFLESFYRAACAHLDKQKLAELEILAEKGETARCVSS
jgi:hypothetical protein